MISQSSAAQSPSSAHSPVSASAAVTRPSRASSSRASVKNRRPVRVYTMPLRSLPNQSPAASGVRQAITTAREPMCFSSQITWATPARR